VFYYLVCFMKTFLYIIHVAVKTTTIYMVMGFNANFSNILVISWQSVLLVEDIRENHRPAAQIRNNL
jgi:hypothetical protein